jgi:hypothetical protein
MIPDGTKIKAIALFREKRSTHHIAEALGISWPTVDKLRKEWLSQPPAEERLNKPPASEDSAPDPQAPEPDANPEDPWDISLKVLPADLNRILLAASESERATAVAVILQARLDAILNPPANETEEKPECDQESESSA